MRHVAGQSYCSLPWCGASFGGPYHSRVFRDDMGLVKLTYPSMIDYHDIVPRSQGGDPDDLGNNVPLCHECHMAHHSNPNKRLTFLRDVAGRSDGRVGVLVLGDRDYLDAV